MHTLDVLAGQMALVTTRVGELHAPKGHVRARGVRAALELRDGASALHRSIPWLSSNGDTAFQMPDRGFPSVGEPVISAI